LVACQLPFSDSRNFETLLDIGPNQQSHIDPTLKTCASSFRKHPTKPRTLEQQTVGKLERVKYIALRSKKTAQNYGSFVALPLGFILIKSAHTV
jgi:hypothetical protein